ncbi:hypothetical protein SCUCBS95973_001221 [Sporothrix curviconia]|uniref:Uncharacterized protein n=1 Tax=Sporothrix curviconia TaxID=1260050 RepID=A0ABP0AWT7_9PEZI
MKFKGLLTLVWAAATGSTYKATTEAQQQYACTATDAMHNMFITPHAYDLSNIYPFTLNHYAVICDAERRDSQRLRRP